MAFVRELTNDLGVILPLWVQTGDQPADFLTKALGAPEFENCVWLSGLERLPSHVMELYTRSPGNQGGV